MSKFGERLIQGAREASAMASGQIETETVVMNGVRVIRAAIIDVAKLRKSMKLSQSEFAARFQIPVATIRDWEQKRSRPEGAARVLLKVIKKDPKAVLRALEDA